MPRKIIDRTRQPARGPAASVDKLLLARRVLYNVKLFRMHTLNRPFRVDIVIVYMRRYRRGHEANFVPPITGIHLAALIPGGYEVRVIHQQVRRSISIQAPISSRSHSSPGSHRRRTGWLANSENAGNEWSQAARTSLSMRLKRWSMSTAW